MKRIIIAAIAVTAFVAGCDLAPKPGAEKKGEAVDPGKLVGTPLDLAASGVTGNAAKEVSAAGMTVSDSITTDHQTAFWSLSEVVPNKAYTFHIKVKKDAAIKNASLLQVDMQFGGEKTTFECPFQTYDGQAAGRKAAEGAAVTMKDVGDSYIVTCPTQSGPQTDAIYAYVFPAVGPANGSYEPTATGSLLVEGVTYELSDLAVPAPAPAAATNSVAAPAAPAVEPAPAGEKK
jgi:hypothetical protein